MNADTALPVTPETERFVIGSILADESLFHQVRPVLEVDDFSLERHRRIYRRACGLYDAGKHVDHVTVMLDMQSAGERESDTLSYLISLNEGLPILPDIGSYVQILRDYSTRRQIMAIAQALTQRAAGNEPVQQILDSMGKMTMDLAAPIEHRGLVSAKELVDRVGLEDLLRPRREHGLMSPWSWFNDATCGLMPGELWVLGGHTSSGKTSAALQFAVNAARHGTGVAIFSLEMGKESLFSRAVYQLSRVDSERAKRGCLSLEERCAAKTASSEIYGLPLYFDDSAASTPIAIHAAVRQRRLQAPIGLIVVDYLQLLSDGGRHDNRAQAVGANARAFKLMASEFGCPVLLLSQFSRESAKPGKQGDAPRRPELSDLKESGDIENHANGVWFVYRPSNVDLDVAPVEFILAKQRDGRRNISKQFLFLSRHQRFEERQEEQ